MTRLNRERFHNLLLLLREAALSVAKHVPCRFPKSGSLTGAEPPRGSRKSDSFAAPPCAGTAGPIWFIGGMCEDFSAGRQIVCWEWRCARAGARWAFPPPTALGRGSGSHERWGAWVAKQGAALSQAERVARHAAVKVRCTRCATPASIACPAGKTNGFFGVSVRQRTSSSHDSSVRRLRYGHSGDPGPVRNTLTGSVRRSSLPPSCQRRRCAQRLYVFVVNIRNS